MPTDNQNNWIHFRADLDQLQQFPEEEPYNKAGGWDKLESRLNKNFSRRRKILSWAAAAAILLFAGIGGLYLLTPSRNFTGVAAGKQNPDVSVRETPTPAFNDTLRIHSNALGGHGGSPHPASYSKPKTRHTKPSPTSPSITILTPPANAQPVPIFSREPIADTLNLVALIHPTVPIRRLKVIHNNRLNSVIYKPELSIGDAGLHRSGTAGYLQFGRNLSDNIIQLKLPSIN